MVSALLLGVLKGKRTLPLENPAIVICNPVVSAKEGSLCEFTSISSIRYRDRGVGSEMAEEIWRLFPGRWQIRVRSDNLAGLKFWKSTIAKFARSPVSAQDVEVKEVVWNLFSFQSGGS